jgi:ribosomal protein S21
VFALCALLVELQLFQTILVQLLPVGHTHDIVDAWFGVISKTLLRERFHEGVLGPQEWIQFLKDRCAADVVQQVWTVNNTTLTFAATHSSSTTLEGFKHGGRKFLFALSTVCGAERTCTCGKCAVLHNTEDGEFVIGLRRPSLVSMRHRPWMQDGGVAFRDGGAAGDIPLFPMPIVFDAAVPLVQIDAAVVGVVGGKVVKLLNGLLRGGDLSCAPACARRPLFRKTDLTVNFVDVAGGSDYRETLLTGCRAEWREWHSKIQLFASGLEDQNACNMAFLASHSASISILRQNATSLSLAAEAGEQAARRFRALSQQETVIIQTSATKTSERRESASRKRKTASAKKQRKKRRGVTAEDDRPLAPNGRKLWSGSQCVHDDVCTVCDKGGMLYLCAYCASVYHFDCLTVLEAADLEDDLWHCPACEAHSDSDAAPSARPARGGAC